MNTMTAKPTPGPVPCSRCGNLYQQTPSQIPRNRRLCKECGRKKAKAWADKRKAENLPVRSDESKARRKADGLKRNRTDKGRAKLRVWRAVHSGALQRKPCEVCGNIKVEAHHDDYSKPLDVRWLCVTHHNEHHRIQREPK